jgi:repressor LexA
VISRTAAGGTVTAVDLTGVEEYVHVPPGIVGAHEHFALEVAGDSMIGKAIIDGDRVVVRRGCEVRNGDTVVAWFDSDTSPEDGEATLKTYKRVGGHVWLMPENPPTTRSPATRRSLWARSSTSPALCAEQPCGEPCSAKSENSAAIEGYSGRPVEKQAGDC